MMGFSLNRYGKFLVPKIITMVIVLMVSTIAYGGTKFHDEFEPSFGSDRIKTYGGRGASLTLDQYSGSGFRSKKDYLFGRVDMPLKLVPGDSSGTVTTFYLTSDQSTGRHDEIDFEFLGNVSGQPYTIHTNVYSEGKGQREQQFHLWFDPTAKLHTYSIVWNPRLIMFLIDNSPIRVFRSNEDIGVPFPKNEPMKIQCSLWSAEWATQGGRVKTDWTKAPFKADYGDFNIDACVPANVGKHGCANAPAAPGSWRTHDIDAKGAKRLKTIQKRYMVYNYCKDTKRYPEGVPKECNRD